MENEELLNGSMVYNEVFDVDGLIMKFSGDAIELSPQSVSSGHPRYTFYKNVARAEEVQRKRRAEFLERQKESRAAFVNQTRNLFLDKADKADQEAMDVVEISSNKNKRNEKYADVLMLSEWLVDIPTNLSSEWIMVPCPVGKRCLIVAKHGVTSAYNKKGNRFKQFRSYLPGSIRSKGSENATLLDCILSYETNTFYCLDVIVWNGIIQSDVTFDCRLFFINSRINENQNFGERSKENPFVFKSLPYCYCQINAMENLLKSNLDFTIDGILFYHSQVFYRSGQSPLVGWLKPWMLPEILNVTVPQRLMDGKETEIGASQKFIDNYNIEHNHISSLK